MKNREFETKVLKIDPAEVSKKLLSLGAKEQPESLMRRVVFDMESDGIEWIRVREQEDKTVMTYKYKPLDKSAIGQTTEIEVTVSDFDKTKEILSKLAFKRVMYQENKVWLFKLNNLEFSIATWPMIDPYLEIEGESEEDVKKGLEMLGLVGQDAGDFDIAKLYEEKGIEMNSIKELKFQ